MHSDSSRSAGRLRARRIFDAALAAVRPETAIASTAARIGLLDELHRCSRILVVGAGKAGAGMVSGLESILGDAIERTTGIVNVPNDQVRSTKAIRLNPARPIGINEPTPAAVAGTNEMIQLVQSAKNQDFVIALLSGGGSALLCSPATEISLEDKIHVTRLLSSTGASIHELNCVRKHLSRVKGGRLAIAAAGARKVVSFIISDVVGDQLDVIASGPTAPDPTTFAHSLEVLSNYRLLDRVSPSVRSYIETRRSIADGESLKTIPATVHNHIIASNHMALRAAQVAAEIEEYSTVVIPESYSGDVIKVASQIATSVREAVASKSRVCLLFGGETTVRLGSDPGMGGRNQELALAIGVKLQSECLGRVTLLCAGTDGEDGPTDAAGAFMDAEIWNAARKLGLRAEDFQARHDSYTFFHLVGGHLSTGLTGTNVMDVCIVLVDSI